jgi:hypothetical protein
MPGGMRGPALVFLGPIIGDVCRIRAYAIFLAAWCKIRLEVSARPGAT